MRTTASRTHVTPRSFVTVLLVPLVLLTALPTDAPAQVGGAVTGAVLGLTGRQILKDTNILINQKLTDINRIGSGLVNQTISGLNISMEAARINLSAAMDKPLRDLNDGERRIFLEIRNATQQLNGMVTKAYRLEEVANVDISSRLGDIVLMKRATFISSISGLALLKSRPEYTIAVIGTGLGPAQEGVSAKLELTLENGGALSPARVDSSQHNTTVLYYSAPVFEKYFQERAVSTVPARITLTVTRKGFLGFRSTQVVTSSLLFSLFPEYAGHMNVAGEAPIYSWVKIESDKKEGWRTADCGNRACGGGGAYEEHFTTPVAGGNSAVVGYKRVVSPRCECGAPWWAPACGYSYLRLCEPVTNMTQLKVAWQQTGVWVTWYGIWDVEEYKRTGVTSVAKDIDLFYGKNASFCIPAAADYYKAVITTITKERLELAPQESVPARFEYVGSFTCEAADKRYEYRVVTP